MNTGLTYEHMTASRLFVLKLVYYEHDVNLQGVHQNSYGHKERDIGEKSTHLSVLPKVC